jgi:tRNA A37 N6-isopentenylltransferase MiaA
MIIHICFQIDNMLKEDIVPILVGGTHYYIQSIIWNVLIDSQTVPDIPTTSKTSTALKTDLLKQAENSTDSNSIMS